MIRNINIIDEQFPMLQSSSQDMNIDISYTFKIFFEDTNHREKSEHWAKRLKDPKIYNMLLGLIIKSLCAEVTNRGPLVVEQDVMPKIVLQECNRMSSKLLCPGTNLPLAQTILTVCFCGPNATIARVSSGRWNWASDHSELKYFGNTPANMRNEVSNYFYRYQNNE